MWIKNGWVFQENRTFIKGDIAVTEFRQVLNVAPGKYTLSFSCTHINANGELEVLNRKYEALLIQYLSSSNDMIVESAKESLNELYGKIVY